jgi:hypothetical protein
MSILKKNTFHRNSTPFLKTYFNFLKEESAISLIDIRRDQLVLNEDALKILKEIKENIIIVSIFGKERTGKSYLMNLLLNSDENPKMTKGFKVHSQNPSSSRGINIWNTPIAKPDSKDKIIFLDSEGIHSENVYQQEMDSKLLALILLISSFFIYNTMGDINSNSLNELELIVHLNDSIGINEKLNKDKLITEICPKFIWAIRDFDLKKLENEKISRDDYMEQCLKERFGGKNKDEINVIKENLIKYFKERECVTLPRPVEEEKDLIMLKKMNLPSLQEDFRDEFILLKNKIYNTSKAKEINGKIINGPMIVYLLRKFVGEINSGNIPNITDLSYDMIKYSIDNNYHKAKNSFTDKLQKLQTEELDLDIKEIYTLKYEAIKEYMNILERYPEISKKQTYIDEYNSKKEKLENEIEKQISPILNDLIINTTYVELFKDLDTNKEYKKSDELIEEYLNKLSEFKINTNINILNNKDFDNFIKDDINGTKKIIDFMDKNNEIKKQNDNNNNNNNNEEGSIKNGEIEINNINTNNINTNTNNINHTNKNDIDADREYEELKKELKKTEKTALELIGKFTKLLDKRDKFLVKNSLKPFNYQARHSIKSYSNKLVNIYYSEENICELSSEEKPVDKCNCSMDRFKNCFIY